MLYPRMKKVIEKETGILVVGYVPELDFWQVGSRHLGLVLPDEIKDLQSQMGQLGDCLEKTLDVDELLRLGESADFLKPAVEKINDSDQNHEIQKDGKTGLNGQPAGEKTHVHNIKFSLVLPGMKLSASTIGTIWNFWKSWGQKLSGSVRFMINICQKIWTVFC